MVGRHYVQSCMLQCFPAVFYVCELYFVLCVKLLPSSEPLELSSFGSKLLLLLVVALLSEGHI